MSITSQTTSVEYTHDGIAVDYLINFMYFESTAIRVFAIDKSTLLSPEPWQNKHLYVVGKLVWTSTNQVFRCITEHTSSVAPANIDNDLVNWELIGAYINGSWYAQTELAVGSDWSLQTTAGGISLATGIKMPDTVRLSSPAVVTTGFDIRITRTTASTQTSQPADKTVEVSLDKLTAQMQEIKSMSTGADDLKVRVDANTADIAALTPRVTTAENDIDSLQVEQTTQNGRLTAVETGKVDNAVVTALDVRVTDLEADLPAVALQASNAMAKALVNEAGIAAIVVDTVQIAINKNDITTLKGRADLLEATDVSHQAQLTNHEGRIHDLELNALERTINGTMDIYNNVSTPTDLTYEYPVGSGTRVPLTYDADEVASVEIEFSLERGSDLSDQPSTGILYMIFRAGQWFIDYGYMYGWNSDIDFSVVTDVPTKVGTVKYVSSNFAGTNYYGIIRFRARQIGKGV